MLCKNGLKNIFGRNKINKLLIKIMNTKNKGLNYYLSLNYEISIKKENDYFVASYKEFPRILGTGNNEIEAINDLKDAFKSFVEVSLKHGDHIREPNENYPSKNYAITMKTNIMEEIDKFAAKLGLSRSAIIAVGMQSYMKSI